MMNMSKNKNNMKKKIALLGSLMTVTGVSVEAATKNYDISVPMMQEHSIFMQKNLETSSSVELSRKAFEYIYKKRLLTMNPTVPVSILTDYSQKLNQQELLYLSGGAECKFRGFCAKYLETSLALNMDKNMDITAKHKERMANALKLREGLVAAFSDKGRKDICVNVNAVINEIDTLLEAQKKEVDAYYANEGYKN